MARDGNGHREAIVVTEGPDGLSYTRIDESGAQTAGDASMIGEFAAQASATFPWFTFALAAFALGSVVLFYAAPWVAALAFSIAAAIGLAVLYNWQRRNKSIVVVYPKESSIVQRRAAAIDALLQSLSASRAAWILLNVGAVFDPRLAAGMGVSVKRMPLRPWKGSPVPIESNVEVWSLDGPTARLVFLPDQLLVIAENRVASFFYSELRANFSNAEFVETEFPMPQDASVLGWRAVHNKQDGTPDRRFKQQQWPACAYSHLQLMAPNGVTFEIIASRADVAPRWGTLWGTLQEASSGGLRGYVSAPQSPPPSSMYAAPPAYGAPAYGAPAYGAPAAQPGYPVLGQMPPVGAPMSAPPAMNALAGLPPPPVMPPVASTYAASSSDGISVVQQGDYIIASVQLGDFEQVPTFDQNVMAPVALLRYLAVADRKFTDDEKDFVLRNASALCNVSQSEIDKMLPYCPTKDGDVQACATRVLTRGAPFVDALVVLLDQLPLIDGKATPNELTRLAQVRKWLGR